MNAIDILSALDSLPEEYILEASTQKAPERPHHPSLLLVAILAGIVAMLAGCAAYGMTESPPLEQVQWRAFKLSAVPFSLNAFYP